MDNRKFTKFFYLSFLIILGFCAFLFFNGQPILPDNGNLILMENIRQQRALIEDLSCELRGVGARGAFCISEEKLKIGGNDVTDFGIAKLLEEKLFRGSTVGDFGAGLGWYGRYWLRNKNRIFDNATDFENNNFFNNGYVQAALKTPKVIKGWEGFDGSGNVSSLTNGFVKYLDLSQPNVLPNKYDWVMSIEVGEHIPKEFEKVFLDNLDNHCCRGIVLSWAVKDQTGFHHVNTRSNEYIKNEMAKRHFINIIDMEKQLRAIAGVWWLRGTLMVFERKVIQHGPNCM